MFAMRACHKAVRIGQKLNMRQMTQVRETKILKNAPLSFKQFI